MRIAPALLAAAALSAALPAAAQAPAVAAPPAAKRPVAPSPRVVNLKNLSCDDFMGLAEGERIPVLWYIAGDYKEAGRIATAFDLDLIPKALPTVWQECKGRPQANLRYVVVNFFKAQRPRPAATKK
jgi:hypothetical protein